MPPDLVDTDPLRQPKRSRSSPTSRAAATRGNTKRRSKASSTTCSGGTTKPRATTSRKTSRSTCRPSTCQACNGARLKPEALAVTIGGSEHQRADPMSVESCREVFSASSCCRRTARQQIAHQILKEIRARLGFLTNVGLGLSQPRAFGDDAFGRRVAAHSVGHADRHVAGRRALHPRRAVDRTASTRQRPSLGDAADPARSSATR